jgi:hypothetical protein
MPQDVQVGMWDSDRQCWSTDSISDVHMTTEGGITFRTKALNPFAVVCSRVALLPYHSWWICPVGKAGTDVLLYLDIGVLDMPLCFEISNGYACLRGPVPAALSSLLDKPMAPVALLMQLRHFGWNLLPENRDAAFLTVNPKDTSVERAMCDDVAQMAGTHLIASSSWSQYVQVRFSDLH